LTNNDTLYLKILGSETPEARQDRLDRRKIDAATNLLYLSHPNATVESVHENENGDISILATGPTGRPLRELYRKSDLQPQMNGGDMD
jgi:hypothetical protein